MLRKSRKTSAEHCYHSLAPDMKAEVDTTDKLKNATNMTNIMILPIKIIHNTLWGL